MLNPEVSAVLSPIDFSALGSVVSSVLVGVSSIVSMFVANRLLKRLLNGVVGHVAHGKFDHEALYEDGSKEQKAYYKRQTLAFMRSNDKYFAEKNPVKYVSDYRE